MIHYEGTVALVTGAGSGIGRAIAVALAARGASVVIADIDADGAHETAELTGAATRVIQCDLASVNAAQAIIEETHAWKGRLDLVCSNAGVGYNRRLIREELGEAARRLFEINLFANLRVAQAYADKARQTGARGRLLVTGSENSLSVPAAVKDSGQGLYAATKHGVLILMEWMRDEFVSGHVPINLHLLLPGPVYTPLIARHIPDPASAPETLALISPERCAELALSGMDLGLFYIPTHRHIAHDMRPRIEGVHAAIASLGL